MPFSMSDREGAQVLALEGVVTIREARALTALLVERLQESIPCIVETAQLEDIDTCILQLLCALKKSVRQLSFVDTGKVFVNALDRSQLKRVLLDSRETL